jgi:hypothetical protein
MVPEKKKTETPMPNAQKENTKRPYSRRVDHKGSRIMPYNEADIVPPRSQSEDEAVESPDPTHRYSGTKR